MADIAANLTANAVVLSNLIDKNGLYSVISAAAYTVANLEGVGSGSANAAANIVGVATLTGNISISPYFLGIRCQP